MSTDTAIPVVITPEQEQLASAQTTQAIQTRPVMIVSSNSDYATMAAHVVELKAKKKYVIEVLLKLPEAIAAANEAHKRLTQMRGRIEAQFDPEINACDGACTKWERDQTRARLAEEDRLRKVEAERVRVAEEERQAEIRRLTEKAREDAVEKQIETAVFYEATGLPEVANEIMSNEVVVEPENVPMPLPITQAPIVIASELPKIAGRRKKPQRWGSEITDRSQIPEEYWLRVLDEKTLRTRITALQGNIQIPGLRIVEE